MENKAHYALIGTFVMLALLAMITFVTWLSGRQSDVDRDAYVVQFTGPVRGLTRGSEVRLNGLSVGEVSKLAFDRDDPNSVLVTVEVIDGTPIFKDGFAQLEPQGLTGLNYVQINPGTISMGRINPDEQKLPGKMSQFDNFLVGGENIIDGATMAIRRVNVLMSEDALNDFHSILKNLNEFTSNIKDTDIDADLVSEMLMAMEQAAKDTSTAALAIEASAKEFDEMILNEVTPVFAKAQTSMDQLNSTLSGYSELADNSTLVTQDMRDAINRLSNSGLADLEETTDALRDLMITLSNIADQLEKSPAQFIAGEEREIMELPQ